MSILVENIEKATNLAWKGWNFDEYLRNSVNRGRRRCQFKHLAYKVQEILSVGLWSELLLNHKRVIIEPNLFIPLYCIVCLYVLLWNQLLHYYSLLDLFDFNVLLEDFLVDKHICIFTRSTTTPFVGYPHSSIAFLFKEGHREAWNSRIIKFDPSSIFLQDCIIMPHIRSARMDDDTLEVEFIVVLALAMKS